MSSKSTVLRFLVLTKGSKTCTTPCRDSRVASRSAFQAYTGSFLVCAAQHTSHALHIRVLIIEMTCAMPNEQPRVASRSAFQAYTGSFLVCAAARTSVSAAG